MDRAFAIGAVLTGSGLVGYLLGLAVSYPGRAFSVTAVMVGITLAAIGSRGGGDSS